MQDFAGVVKLYRDSSIHDQEIADEFKHILNKFPARNSECYGRSIL